MTRPAFASKSAWHLRMSPNQEITGLSPLSRMLRLFARVGLQRENGIGFGEPFLSHVRPP